MRVKSNCRSDGLRGKRSLECVCVHNVCSCVCVFIKYYFEDRSRKLLHLLPPLLSFSKNNKQNKQDTASTEKHCTHCINTDSLIRANHPPLWDSCLSSHTVHNFPSPLLCLLKNVPHFPPLSVSLLFVSLSLISR